MSYTVQSKHFVFLAPAWSQINLMTPTAGQWVHGKYMFLTSQEMNDEHW